MFKKVSQNICRKNICKYWWVSRIQKVKWWKICCEKWCTIRQQTCGSIQPLLEQKIQCSHKCRNVQQHQVLQIYLYKYVYKGPDMASVTMELEKQRTSQEGIIDEISKFVNARFVTASEGCWRIFCFDVHGWDPSIQRLAVHEENTQIVWFHEHNPEEAIANLKDTTLLAWFKLNESHPEAQKFKYHEIPEHFVWNSTSHRWTPRKRRNCIGCMYTTSPSQGEWHYLRILLHHIPGAISFNDLKTSPDGVIHKTFKETALAFGLLKSDEEWDDCLSEATLSYMPKQLCSLFVTILIFGEPAKPSLLWENHKEAMGEDIFREASLILQGTEEELISHVHNEVLLLLQDDLESMETCLENFGLPTPNNLNRIKKVLRIIQEETFDTETKGNIWIKMQQFKSRSTWCLLQNYECC